MIWLTAFAGFVLAAIYIRWKIRYRFPPGDFPHTLCYHKITRRFCFEGTWTTPDRFFSQIDTLIGKGYRFIGEETFFDFLDRRLPSGCKKGIGEYEGENTGINAEEGAEETTGKNALGDPGKNLFLTFDDGYAEIYRLLLSGLEDRNIPFHVFLVTDYAGRENNWDLSLGRRPFRHLSWDEAREMARLGVSFGSHGATHRDLTRLTEKESSLELRRSKSRIEEILGTPVCTFSYPFGRYNNRLKHLTEAAGYRAAFSLYPSHENKRIDRYALRRNGVYIIDTRRSIFRKLEQTPLFWLEEMKCRGINSVAAATPILKKFAPDRESRDG